jgi:chromosome segregation ATPase
MYGDIMAIITGAGNYLAELAVTGLLAVSALAVGFQTILKNWKSTATESSLLKMMHEELERMSSQNFTLSNEIGKLQLELIRLGTQLSELTRENQKLHGEVSLLNKEISRLQSMITGKE